jgi:hypothetical protein
MLAATRSLRQRISASSVRTPPRDLPVPDEIGSGIKLSLAHELEITERAKRLLIV